MAQLRQDSRGLSYYAERGASRMFKAHADRVLYGHVDVVLQASGPTSRKTGTGSTVCPLALTLRRTRGDQPVEPHGQLGL